MDNNNNENLDSLNEEDVVNPEDDNNPDFSDDAKQKVKDLSDKNKQLFERAKKAEKKEKELRDKIEQFISENPEKDKMLESQPSEPDYAKLAFLKSEGISHPDDQKYAQDEANRLKLPLTDVLQMEHVKSRLENSRVDREAKSAIPKGGSGVGNTQSDVNYWLEKGGLPQDQAIAEKVVEARKGSDSTNQPFDDIRV